MTRSVIAAAFVCVVAAWSLPAAPSEAQEPCKFVLGFAALRDLVGAQKVGACLEDEHFNLENGNAEQRTSGGLLVWRKVDNFTAFTDGGTSWINGPNGLQTRPNSERFSWEKDPVRTVAGATPAASEGQRILTSVPATVAADSTRSAVDGATRVATLLATSAPTATTAPAATKAATATTRAAPVPSGGDKNCDDYKSQADAQAELRAHPEDRYGLDTDKDGIACEGNKAPKDTRKVPR